MEFLAGHRVDLLLTDLAMPVMSGMELMRIVRKQYPHIAIVVLTLHQDFEYIQDCLRLGAIDYIAKVELETDSYDEVMDRIIGRIMEEKTKSGVIPMLEDDRQNYNWFYEARHELKSPAAAPGTPPRSETASEVLPAELKQIGLSLGWVHKNAEYAAFLESLKKAALPPHRLTTFLNSMLQGWNPIYTSVTRQQLELPEAFSAWYEVEEWLDQARVSLSSAIGKPQYSGEVKECIARAVQAIHEEFSGPVTASAIAGQVNMSRSYFSQCFKDIIGMTFNEYLRSVRVDKAKDYLQYTQKNVQWISEHTGYTDQKYFSRVFHGRTGMLPTEYRQAFHSGKQMSDLQGSNVLNCRQLPPFFYPKPRPLSTM